MGLGSSVLAFVLLTELVGGHTRSFQGTHRRAQGIIGYGNQDKSIAFVDDLHPLYVPSMANEGRQGNLTVRRHSHDRCIGHTFII